MSNAKGALFSPVDIRDYRIACAVSATVFPVEFELDYMPPVKNQGSVGSCVAHAVSTEIEYFNHVQGDSESEMSVGYIYGNRRNSTHSGTGMYTRDAIAAACEYGDVVRTLFPYNEEVPGIIDLFEKNAGELFAQGYPHRFTSYYRCANTAEIKTALMKNVPVIFAIEWYSDMRPDKYGVIQTLLQDKDKDGGHCMVIYGWDERGWKIQNSWGENWGNGGRAILTYSVPIVEAWGIVDDISENQRKKRIEELEKSNAELLENVDELTARISTLLDQIAALRDDRNADKETYAELSRSLAEASEELKTARETIDRKSEEIKRLTDELTEVKKPFDSKFGQVVAKVINFAITAFYFVVNWFTKKKRS